MKWFAAMFRKNPGLTVGASVALLLWIAIISFVCIGIWALAFWMPVIVAIFVGCAARDDEGNWS